MVANRRYTSADLDELPYEEGVRYEIIDGVLYVSRAPHAFHQGSCQQVARVLGNWNEVSGAGFVLPGAGLIFSPDNDEIPDIVWISHERLAATLDAAGHLHIAPELVIEVLSAGAENEARDRQIKLGLYSRQGVLEYWIVDWRQREVEIYRRDGDQLPLASRLEGEDALTTPLLEGFRCPLSSLWIEL